MKKFLKVLLWTVGSMIAVIALLLAITSVVNIVATNSEAEKIESYGQLVDVDGKKMNVVVSGSGDETIVLLPGFGTAAPGLDFLPLITELSPHFRVVVVEPFGYGLSDTTEKERTTENIVSEVHEALQTLGITQYVLGGHSIAGIYGLNYVASYPDEVTAFLGIDTSVPGQPGMDEELPVAEMQIAKSLGLMRVLSGLSDPYAGLPFDAQTKEQILMLSNKNSLGPNYLSEMKHISSNFADALGTTFPQDLPVLLFVETNNSDIASWADLHTEQAASVAHGEVVFLDGSHYLHHTQSEKIAADTKRFLAEISTRSAAASLEPTHPEYAATPGPGTAAAPAP